MLMLATVDALSIISLYNWSYLHLTGHYAGISASVIAMVLLWTWASYLSGRYSSSYENSGRRVHTSVFETLLVASLLLGMIAIASWALNVDDPRTFRRFAIPIVGGTATISTLCELAFNWGRSRRRGTWLVVGDRNEIRLIQEEIAAETRGLRCSIDYLDIEKVAGSGITRRSMLEGIAVSEVSSRNDEAIKTIIRLRSKGVKVCSLVNWCEDYLQRVPPEVFTTNWLIQADGFELRPTSWRWRLKRAGDILASAILLVVTSPMLLLSAVAILIEDGKPVLFSQERNGLYGQRFTLRKLRTMRRNAEADGAQWAKPNDPRITRVGSLLRKTRIDELPQLINVLKGEMSLIGPRPERAEMEDVLSERISHYNTRHWARPGLSGWAQVCYRYGASVKDSRMKLSYDIYYVRNANILLDLLIALKTMKLVSKAEGSTPAQGKPQKELSKAYRDDDKLP